MTYLQIYLIVGPKRAVDLVERDVVVGQCVQQLGYYRHLVLIRELMIVAHPGHAADLLIRECEASSIKMSDDR